MGRYTLSIMCSIFLMGSWGYSQTGQYQNPSKKAGDAKPKANQGATPAQKDNSKSTKVDIQDIENQYWQQKDQDFHVVQNRLFTKDKRFFISPKVGLLVNDSFTKGISYGIASGYYFNERSGIEIGYTQYDVKNSKTTSEALRMNGSVAYNKLENQLTATYNWMPIYGKISLFDSSIIYFDMGINVGLGLVGYEKQLELGNKDKKSVMLILDISQQFFVHRNMAVRFDIQNRFYKEDRETYRNSTGPIKETEHSLSAALGFVFYFGSGSNAEAGK